LGRTLLGATEGGTGAYHSGASKEDADARKSTPSKKLTSWCCDSTVISSCHASGGERGEGREGGRRKKARGGKAQAERQPRREGKARTRGAYRPGENVAMAEVPQLTILTSAVVTL
jgi:hypothetical protein